MHNPAPKTYSHYPTNSTATSIAYRMLPLLHDLLHCGVGIDCVEVDSNELSAFDQLGAIVQLHLEDVVGQVDAMTKYVQGGEG